MICMRMGGASQPPDNEYPHCRRCHIAFMTDKGYSHCPHCGKSLGKIILEKQ